MKKEKISRRKHTVDTLTDTATVRSSHRGCSVRKGVLRNFAKFTGKHLCQSLFLIKMQDWDLQLYLKRDSGLGVFLWNFRHFWEHLFYRTFLGECFWTVDFGCASLSSHSKKANVIDRRSRTYCLFSLCYIVQFLILVSWKNCFC